MHADPLMHAEQHERAMAAREAETAYQIEVSAEHVRRSIEPRDVMSDAVDVDDEDILLELIHADRFDEAGAEWARRVSEYCLRCAEIQVGVAPMARNPAALDTLTGRDEWAGALRGLEARFMPLGA